MARSLKALGFDLEAAKVADAIVVRESGGDRCSVHVLGQNEFGLGPAGLFVRFHLRKWDADADPRVLHQVGVSAYVLAVIFRNAKYRFRAKSWKRLGAIFAGRILWTDWARDVQFCKRLARKGVDCENPISKVR